MLNTKKKSWPYVIATLLVLILNQSMTAYAMEPAEEDDLFWDIEFSSMPPPQDEENDSQLSQVQKKTAQSLPEMASLIGKLVGKASRGDSVAAYGLACLSLRKNSEENYLFWLKKSAELGHAKAQCCLGNLFNKDNPYRLVDPDDNLAFKWYLESANQDYPEAQYQIGFMYTIGRGTLPNRKESFGWMLKAATKYHIPAMQYVVWAYTKGSGGQKNIERANDWKSLIEKATLPLPHKELMDLASALLESEPKLDGLFSTQTFVERSGQPKRKHTKEEMRKIE